MPPNIKSFHLSHQQILSLHLFKTAFSRKQVFQKRYKMKIGEHELPWKYRNVTSEEKKISHNVAINL